MKTKDNPPADSQAMDKTKTSSKKGLSVGAILGLALMLIGSWNAFPAFRPNSHEADARKDAELRVQNSVYTSVGAIPKTESTVVYKNKHYIIVGVNYTFENNFKTNAYWSRIIGWSRNSEMVFKSSDDLGGWDIHNLTKDQMDQIRVFFELE